MTRVITILQLRERNVQLAPELSLFYQIYHQYIVCNLTPLLMTTYIKQAISHPLLYDVVDKQWFIFNQLLLFYLLYDYENHAILHPTESVVLQKMGDPSIIKIKVFYEMMDVIKHHRKTLPINSLFHQLKPLLNPEDCQSICQKNIFTSKVYCNLIGISIATFKLAN